MRYGSKFWLLRNLNINQIINELFYNMDMLKYKVSVYHSKSTAYFYLWKYLLITKFKWEIKNKSSRWIACNKTELFQIIAILQKSYVLTCITESPNNSRYFIFKFYHIEIFYSNDWSYCKSISRKLYVWCDSKILGIVYYFLGLYAML